jgi:beta-lactamase class A
VPPETRTVKPQAVHARRRTAFAALAVLTAAAFAAGALVGASSGGSGGPNRLGAQPSGPGGPAGSKRRVADAIAYAAARRGVVAFAVIDARGRLRGMNVRTPFIAASVVKAMLLVAELERLLEQRLPLDEDARDTLERMIRESDNEAATSVYRRVGDRRLRALAGRAGMGEGFRLGPLSVPTCRCSATGWARAQVTAGGQARFFRAFPRLVPARDRAFARSILARIVPEQRWGIPQEVPAGWQAFFKIGVRETGLGTAVHQAARLETSGKVVALAVLTDGNPSEGYGKATVRGVARAIVGDATP